MLYSLHCTYDDNTRVLVVVCTVYTERHHYDVPSFSEAHLQLQRAQQHLFGVRYSDTSLCGLQLPLECLLFQPRTQEGSPA